MINTNSDVKMSLLLVRPIERQDCCGHNLMMAVMGHDDDDDDDDHNDKEVEDVRSG